MAAADNVLVLEGTVNAESAPKILKQSRKYFKDKSSLVIDFTKVEYADSVALALILGWQRQANNAGLELKLKNIPDDLKRIARLSELETIVLS